MSEVLSSDTTLLSLEGKLVPILPLTFKPRGAEFITVVVLLRATGEFDYSFTSVAPKFIWKLSIGVAS